MIKKWYEIWADDGLEIPYLLVVVPEDDDEGIRIIDTKEAGQVVHRAIDYESAKMWLQEDEYRLVKGRMVPD